MGGRLSAVHSRPTHTEPDLKIYGGGDGCDEAGWADVFGMAHSSHVNRNEQRAILDAAEQYEKLVAPIDREIERTMRMRAYLLKQIASTVRMWFPDCQVSGHLESDSPEAMLKILSDK